MLCSTRKLLNTKKKEDFFINLYVLMDYIGLYEPKDEEQ